MAMDGLSVVKEIYAACKYLREVHEMAKKLGDESAEIVARILKFEACLKSFENDQANGRFQEPGQLQALLSLHEAVLAAEG